MSTSGITDNLKQYTACCTSRCHWKKNNAVLFLIQTCFSFRIQNWKQGTINYHLPVWNNCLKRIHGQHKPVQSWQCQETNPATHFRNAHLWIRDNRLGVLDRGFDRSKSFPNLSKTTSFMSFVIQSKTLTLSSENSWTLKFHHEQDLPLTHLIRNHYNLNSSSATPVSFVSCH
jgi:hypothetical protein